MATSKSVDSIGDLTALMQEFSDSNKTKQLEDLKKSIENLSKILENKIGVNKKQKDDDGPRTLTKDIKDFFQQPYKDVKSYFGFGEDKKARTLKKDSKEFVEEPLKEAKTYFGIKNKMPDNLELKQEESSVKKGEEITGESIRNSVNKAKASPFQKKILDEVIKIKSLLTKSKSETPSQANTSASGIEPNSDEEKQKDRELLAEAIANKLSDLMDSNSSGAGFFGAKPPIPTTASPAATAAAAAAGSAALTAGTVGSVAVGGAAATGLATGILASEQAKPLREAVTQNSMLGAMSGDTAMAAGILDANGDKSAEEVRALQQTEQDKLKDAPWYTRMYGIGKQDYLNKQEKPTAADTGNTDKLKESLRIKEQSLKNIDPNLESNTAYRSKLQSEIDSLNLQIKNESTPNQNDAETSRLMRSTPKTEAPVDASVSPTGYKWEPISYDAEKKYGSPKIDPIQTGDQKINYLKQIEDQNKELNDMTSKLSSQIITPMISNNNIDNSRQTIMPAQPNPYTNGKGFNSWQTRVDGKL
jgi:hypothetical protein